MPADYQSAAAALSIPTSPSPIPSPTSERRGSSGAVPPWAQPNPSSARRLSTRRPFSMHSASGPSNQPFITRMLRTVKSLAHQAYELFLSLSLMYRVAVVIACLVAFVLSILALVYSHKIFAILGPIAKTWRELPGGWVLLWLITFATAFPPIFGYSTSLTLAGFVYGFPWGWPIVATATVAGSLVAFLTSRGIFSGYVHQLVGQDKRFVALGQVLRRDGVGMLAMIRLCPLPFSLSNGFLATIPSIRPWAFAAATAIASPKIAVHVFIGSRLALLAEEGDSMSAGDRAVNYIFIVMGGILGFAVGLLIYKRTMARATELAREEAEEAGLAIGDDAGDYADSGEQSQLMRSVDMMDPDAAALAMDDDDISLWEADGVEGGYKDSWDEEAAVEGDGDVKGSGSRNGLSI